MRHAACARSTASGTLRGLAAALCAALPLALSLPVRADTYQVLRGSLTDVDGRVHAITGELEATYFPEVSSAIDPPTLLLIDDFSLAAAALTLGPRQPVEFDGLTPSVYLEVADQIQLEAPEVTWLRLRSGGELVAESESEITFRFLELRSEREDAGHVVGELRASGAPRRLHLAGRLVEVDQTFRLPDPACGNPPLGGGGVIISYDEFDLSQGGTVTFTPPGGANISIGRITGGGAILGGSLVLPGSHLLVAPAPLLLGPVTNALAPTLEDLGITAPSGATVVFEEGALTVTTEGDLRVSGDGLSQLEGVTSVTLIAGGAIVFDLDLTWPQGIDLSLESGRSGGGDEVIHPPPPTPVISLCFGLQAVYPPQERELGTFSLVATAAEPIDIDVRPRHDGNAVHPGSHQHLPVAILASPQLDLRDLDPRSPRLGPGEAGPRAASLHRSRGRHADEPGYWLGLFSVRDAGIAFGDGLVCLLAERRDGGLLEGCDAIETRPRRRGMPPDRF